MGFWSGEVLHDRGSELITDFDPANIDCAAYVLGLGEEAFVTCDKLSGAAPGDPLVVQLGEAPTRNKILIPPGQFAFLLTMEEVTIPKDAVAFISVKTTYKFKGLLNVSGFHVDPGWRGKLIFGVYNAGAQEIILERGQKLFLIFFASLDTVCEERVETMHSYKGNGTGRKGIPVSLLENMRGQIFSPLMLQREIKDLTGKVFGNIDKISQHESSISARMAKHESTMHDRMTTSDAKIARFEDKQASLWKFGKILMTLLVVFASSIAGALSFDVLRPKVGHFIAGLMKEAGYEIVQQK